MRADSFAAGTVRTCFGEIVTIASNLQLIESRVAEACRRAGRRRDEVTLIAVSKTFPAEAIDEAIELGVRNIGENKVQEFRGKRDAIRGAARWHMIGHLQTNKAKEAARLFDVIHSVDSPALAQKLAAEAAVLGKALEVLIQVNVGGEAQKSGVEPAEARGVVDAISKETSLRVVGLMTVPPVATEAETRQYFRTLRSLKDELYSAGHHELTQLSMGMTEDFEMAIEEGATMIRLGRAIFGTRG